MKKLMWVCVVGAGLFVLGHGAQAASQKSPVAQEREHKMEDMAKSMKVLGTMVRGKKKFDQEVVNTHSKKLSDDLAAVKDLFPEGSQEGSDSLPTVWSDRAGFDAALASAQKAVGTLSQAKTKEELKVALQGVGETCKACHVKYREP